MAKTVVYDAAAFNRTIVELKSTNSTPDSVWFAAFNRTIVELKSGLYQMHWKKYIAFNRTIVELKSKRSERTR